MTYTWKVFYHNTNTNKIETFDIFDHDGFNASVSKLMKRKLTRDEFSKELKAEARYYFWSKYDYETVVTTWPPHIKNDNLVVGMKIDVFQQLLINWDNFVDYIFGYE